MNSLHRHFLAWAGLIKSAQLPYWGELEGDLAERICMKKKKHGRAVVPCGGQHFLTNSHCEIYKIHNIWMHGTIDWIYVSFKSVCVKMQRDSFSELNFQILSMRIPLMIYLPLGGRRKML